MAKGDSSVIATGVCPCCRPNVLIGAEGEVMVFWRKVFPGSIRDMVVATSHDRGHSFGPPVRLAVDNWKLEGCPDSGVAVARAGSRIYAAWLTEASTEHRGVRFSWSDDAGVHWAPSVSASQSVFDANYPSLSTAENGRVLLVFQGRDPSTANGWSPISAFLVEVERDGELSQPMLVPNNGRPVLRPTVFAATGDRAFICWTAAKSGMSEAVIERARRK